MVFLGWQILDAADGRLIYEFPSQTTKARAVGEIEVGGSLLTYLFRALKADGEVTTTAWDVTNMLTTNEPEPIFVWSEGDVLPDKVPAGNHPYLNVQKEGVYLSIPRGIEKRDVRTGNLCWSISVESKGPVAIGDVALPDPDDDTQTMIKQVVIAAGGFYDPAGYITAIDDADDSQTYGEIIWQREFYRAGQPTLLPAPINRVVVPIRVLAATKGKKGKIFVFQYVACFEGDTGDDLWKRDIGNEYPWFGPVAVRYEYNESTGLPFDATVYATTAGYDGETPIYAFNLTDGSNAWGSGDPFADEPVVLPADTAAVPTATNDRVFVPLQDGNIYSFDALTGEDRHTVNFDVRGYPDDSLIATTYGSSYVLYTRSDRGEFMALAPQAHNMALIDLLMPKQIDRDFPPSSVDVTVENLGSYQEDGVLVEVLVDSEVVGWTTKSYHAGESRTFPITIEWDLTDPGPYEVTAQVHPLAGEVGVYDNTLSQMVTVVDGEVVVIAKADWFKREKRLEVEATSSRQPAAALWVQYDGQDHEMTYMAENELYTYSARVPKNPKTVLVWSNQGGSDTVDVTVR